MSFDGPAENFVVAWVNGRLGPRKMREGSLWHQVHGLADTLFSYAVPIASIYDRKFVVVSTREALSRTSATTNRHLGWVERAVAHASIFDPEQTATLTAGTIPETEGDWEEVLVAFDMRNEGRSGGPLRGVGGLS